MLKLEENLDQRFSSFRVHWNNLGKTDYWEWWHRKNGGIGSSRASFFWQRHQLNENTWTKSLLEIWKQAKRLLHSRWVKSDTMNPIGKLMAFIHRSPSLWHSIVKLGENSELLPSPWEGKEKIGPYFQHPDFVWGAGFCLACI